MGMMQQWGQVAWRRCHPVSVRGWQSSAMQLDRCPDASDPSTRMPLKTNMVMIVLETMQLERFYYTIQKEGGTRAARRP